VPEKVAIRVLKSHYNKVINFGIHDLIHKVFGHGHGHGHGHGMKRVYLL